MENTERIHKMVGSRKTKKLHALGKENASRSTLKRAPLRQLQINVTRDVNVAHSLLGKKKIRSEDAEQFPKAVSKADIPIHAISSSSSKADTPTPVHAVSNSNVDGPILPVSKVDASCQVDDPTELPVEDLYAAKPSEKYWELFAKKTREELDDAHKENMKLRKEVEQLKETVKALQHKNSDGEYYAMMYDLTRHTSTADT